MERKRLRLPNYDYSQAGVYFLTLCAKDKAPLFGKVCVGGGALDAPHIELNECGAAVEQWITRSSKQYTDKAILKYVVMPNHVHLLAELYNGPSRAPAPTRGDDGGPSRANQTIPAFVSALKRMTNKTCGVQLWQRGYHDHIIRDDAEFLRIWTYVDTNPAKWAEDEYFVR